MACCHRLPRRMRCPGTRQWPSRRVDTRGGQTLPGCSHGERRRDGPFCGDRKTSPMSALQSVHEPYTILEERRRGTREDGLWAGDVGRLEEVLCVHQELF